MINFRKFLAKFLPLLGTRQSTTAAAPLFLPLPAKDDPQYKEKIEAVYSELRSLTKTTGVPELLPPHLVFAFYSTAGEAAYRRRTVFSPHTSESPALQDVSPVLAQYFAGLIDGDGHIRKDILPSGGSRGGFTITAHLYNEALVLKLAEHLGGTVYMDSITSHKTTVNSSGVTQHEGPLAARLRFGSLGSLYNLAVIINGRSINSVRTPQLNILSIDHNLAIKTPSAADVNMNNAWFLGLFDSDGSIKISRIDPLL